MAFPNIHPIEPGRDGWKPVFDNAVSRLLYHCGIVPMGLKVKPGQRSSINWSLPIKGVPAWQRSEELRPLPVTLKTLEKVLTRLYKARGTDVCRDILRVHGNAPSLARVKTRDYQHIYVACMIALDSPPVRR